MTLPPCPECSSEYTYEMPPLLVCPECAHEWQADQDPADGEAGDGARVVRDSVGNVLADGDTVVVAKDLKLKGTSGIKGGTKVKGIRLIAPDEVVDGHDIDCKIDGIGRLQLKSSVVKKA
jgi:protein PhnA